LQGTLRSSLSRWWGKSYSGALAQVMVVAAVVQAMVAVVVQGAMAMAVVRA